MLAWRMDKRTALLALASATAIVLWIGSYWFFQVLTFCDWSGRRYVVDPRFGRIYARILLTATPVYPGVAEGRPIPEYAMWGQADPNKSRSIAAVGFAAVSSTHLSARPMLPRFRLNPGGRPIPFPDDVESQQRTALIVRSVGLAIPYWSIALITAFLPLKSLYRRTKRSWRRQRGRCPMCGYDLRASPQACPECGSERTHPAGLPSVGQ
jgi:hypothetical protein